jgi:hypothetical protein
MRIVHSSELRYTACMTRRGATSSTPATDKSSTVWVAVIGGLAVVLAAAIPAYLAKNPRNEQTNFLGIVKSKNGLAVPGAKVVVVTDQNIPQTFYTDSNGDFHVPIETRTASLHLTVDADGYLSKSLDANPHRSGPEDIQLDTAPPLSPPAAAPPAPKQETTTGNVTTHGNQSPINIGNGNQTNYDQPPPKTKSKPHN